MEKLNRIQRVKLAAHRGIKFTKKKSPAILLVGGVVGFGATAYLAYKAQPKVEKIIDGLEEQNDLGLEINKLTVAKDMSKALALPIAAGILSTTALVFSYNIQAKRIMTLAGALGALQAAHDKFERNFRRKYGDEEYAKFVTTDYVETTEIDKDGNEVPTVSEIKADLYDSWGAFWNNSEHYASDSHTYNIAMIDECERKIDLKLFTKGTILLNEALDILGLPRTRSGAVLGWTTADYFNIERITYNEEDSRGELKPNILLKWSTPKYIYDEVEYED